jgi:asparagine synthase (glutamine-hydrolysing)
MCGIAGLVGNDMHEGSAIARRMADRLSHRGPDAGGAWAEGGVALGHRRLSILDLSPAGAQPMHSACGRWVIVFNGEIYNHLDLRRSLEAESAAPDWRGHSDTETLLAAVARWGLDEALRRSAGMFALAIWDRRARRLWLARDRIGEKPLYWGWAGRALVFGSELKALAAHPDFAGGIDRGALVQYLRFSYVPVPRSIHPGIYKLEPGTTLELDAPPPAAPPSEPLRPGGRHGSISIRRWWDLNTVTESGARDPLVDPGQAVAALEATLSAAVARQMLADVPLGAFLSGGVDSSTIVALMQRHSARPVRTFTIGFDDPAFDESPHAEAVARHLGTDHQTLRVTAGEARDVIPVLPDLYDEPFADSSQIPTHLVCRAARAQVTVALSGDAGDELFGGYNRYVLGPGIWRRIAWMPPGMRRALGAAACSVPRAGWDSVGAIVNKVRPQGSGLASLGDKVHRVGDRLRRVNSLDDLHRSVTSIWTEPQLLLATSLTEPHSTLDDPLPRSGVEDPAAWMMVQDLRSYLPDDILCKVDRAAMGVGLETRVPFLDPEVIALSARLPVGLKIREGRGKWVLRQVLYRHVPAELIDRPKAGFAIPVGPWLRGPLRDWAEDLLAPDRLAADGLLNPAPIRQAWAEHLSGRRDWTARLWVILMFQAWRIAAR